MQQVSMTTPPHPASRNPGVLSDCELANLVNQHARCARSLVDADQWFPYARDVMKAREQAADAIAVCRACPVRAQCLELSFRYGSRFGVYGVWGGLVEGERRSLRRSWRHGHAASEPRGIALGHVDAGGDHRLIEQQRRAMTLSVRVHPGGKDTIVQVSGDLDVCEEEPLQQILLRIMRSHSPRLLLDLAEVSFMDCAGLRVLIRTRRRAELRRGSVQLVAGSPAVCRILSLTGMRDVFPIGETCHPKVSTAEVG